MTVVTSLIGVNQVEFGLTRWAKPSTVPHPQPGWSPLVQSWPRRSTLWWAGHHHTSQKKKVSSFSVKSFAENNLRFLERMVIFVIFCVILLWSREWPRWLLYSDWGACRPTWQRLARGLSCYHLVAKIWWAAFWSNLWEEMFWWSWGWWSTGHCWCIVCPQVK